MLQYAYGYTSATDNKRTLVLREEGNFEVVPNDELAAFGKPQFFKILHLALGRPMTMSADDLTQLEARGYAFTGVLHADWREK